MDSEESNKKVMQLFSSLSDKTRLNIILSLAEKPRTVNDIHRQLGKDNLTLSAVSHQLKLLSDLNIISYEKKGKEKLFSLSDKICWCLLRDAFGQFDKKIKIQCKRCEDNNE
ncbi:MAG TPA: metalloregulator ArsR/SmtB family transcription factor [Candidatus Nanoarchaeia archaeon]|nr:metalloregulator ArsR/SmtB family transcription factor [Candidatus Nanoarchaeia archaeon]